LLIKTASYTLGGPGSGAAGRNHSFTGAGRIMCRSNSFDG
jgi:hypothetical protein